ncbi:MAG: hypothetical protein LBM97_00975 [Candidatus Nomurabacteria bacterium]|nr:hypothetical protein [Candidatus Nomurabacteria bacterium]
MSAPFSWIVSMLLFPVVLRYSIFALILCSLVSIVAILFAKKYKKPGSVLILCSGSILAAGVIAVFQFFVHRVNIYVFAIVLSACVLLPIILLAIFKNKNKAILETRVVNTAIPHLVLLTVALLDVCMLSAKVISTFADAQKIEQVVDEEIGNTEELRISQRNTQRKNDMARLVSAIVMYQANNRNNLPDDWGKLVKSYMLAGGDIWDDVDGVAYVIVENKSASDGWTPSRWSGDHKVYVSRGYACDGSEIITSGRTSKLAVQYALEGGGVVCLNN